VCVCVCVCACVCNRYVEGARRAPVDVACPHSTALALLEAICKLFHRNPLSAAATTALRCVCVCVCVYERDRGRWIDGGVRRLNHVAGCVCVCVVWMYICVFVHVCAGGWKYVCAATTRCKHHHYVISSR